MLESKKVNVGRDKVYFDLNETRITGSRELLKWMKCKQEQNRVILTNEERKKQ